MSTNFLQFDPNAVNMLSDADYNASNQRVNGVQAGLAQSALQNKFQYQASTMVAALGQALSNAGETVSDANLAGLVTSITSVFGNAYATIAQTIAAASSILAVTPASLGALWFKGTNIASATTITIPSSGGGFFHVTGTTTITGISEVTSKNGRTVRLVFDGALILTHNATSLILPTGADITTAAGDTAVFVQEDASNNYWRCVDYQRKNGQALAQPYTSSNQTITSGGTLTLAHGLGSIPSIVMAYLVCQTTEAGYSVGQVVPLSFYQAGQGANTAGYGVSIAMDATNINVQYGNVGVSALTRTGTPGQQVVLTNSNWRLVVKAWA